MSYALTPVVVDLDEINNLMGSKDVEFLKEFVDLYRDEMLEDDISGIDPDQESEDEIRAEYDLILSGQLPEMLEGNEGFAIFRTPLFKKILKFLMIEIDEGECGGEEVPQAKTTATALVHMVMGGSPDKTRGFRYGFALQLLCEHFGEIPDHNAWSPIGIEAFEFIDSQLMKAGVSVQTLDLTFPKFETRDLILRGPPVRIPESDDWPSIGYLNRVEAQEALALLQQPSVNEVIAVAGDDSDWLNSAIGELRSWLETCVAKQRDLVCFYA